MYNIAFTEDIARWSWEANKADLVIIRCEVFCSELKEPDISKWRSSNSAQHKSLQSLIPHYYATTTHPKRTLRNVSHKEVHADGSCCTWTRFDDSDSRICDIHGIVSKSFHTCFGYVRTLWRFHNTKIDCITARWRQVWKMRWLCAWWVTIEPETNSFRIRRLSSHLRVSTSRTQISYTFTCIQEFLK